MKYKNIIPILQLAQTLNIKFKQKITPKLIKLECLIFGHSFKNFSTFTKRSMNVNTGQRFCTNCGKLQYKTKTTLREKIINNLNK